MFKLAQFCQLKLCEQTPRNTPGLGPRLEREAGARLATLTTQPTGTVGQTDPGGAGQDYNSLSLSNLLISFNWLEIFNTNPFRTDQQTFMSTHRRQARLPGR